VVEQIFGERDHHRGERDDVPERLSVDHERVRARKTMVNQFLR
jgi:hypothetical protein